MSDIVDEIESRGRNEKIEDFRVGDTVDVHYRIVEGDKERVPVFTGTIIAVRGPKNRGTRGSFTVRRIVQGEGVERIFPFASPRVEKVVVKRTGRVRRAKLHYLRGRTGKATRLAERRDYKGTRREAQKDGTPAASGDDAAPEDASGEPPPDEQQTQEA